MTKKRRRRTNSPKVFCDARASLQSLIKPSRHGDCGRVTGAGRGLTQLKLVILIGNQLTDVTALKGLTQLTELHLLGNPDLTKAQIAELQKALPKCEIFSNPTK